MKTSKKILGLLLALVMMFNVFAIASVAAFPDDTAVKLMIRADKESYKPGDTATLTFSVQSIEAIGNLRIGGQYTIAYPTSVISPSGTDDITTHNFVALADGYDESISAVQTPETAWTSIDANGVANYGWDEQVTYNVGDDQGTTSFDAYTAAVDLFTVDVVIDDTAADGTYTIGYNSASYEEWNGYINDTMGMGGLYGSYTGADLGLSVDKVLEYGTCEIVVSSVEPSIVNPLKGQIRFDKNTDGTYANTFDVRALAVISGEDFEELFTDVDTARAEQSIQEAGFVFAAGSNVAAPSMDAVKALVESGTAAAGYTKKTVEFISTSVSAGDYVFSCIVENIPDADKTNSLVAVGYIKYVSGGETLYAYYPAAQTVSYSELFNAHYNTAFGA